MSAPVNTATTQGAAAAADRSMPRMRAWACGERTSTLSSAPGCSMSATNFPRPSRKRRSSTRRSGAPMPWSLGRVTLLQFLAHQVEPLERRLVGDHEQVGVATLGFVTREGPVRDGEHVVLRPFEALVADGRAALARDDEADH